MGGRRVPSGLVSVIPHAWRTSRPCSLKPSIIDCGTAAPPTTIERRAERSQRSGSASSAARIAIHTVGTPAVMRHPLALEQVEDALGVEVGTGEDEAGAGEGRRVGQSPGVGVEHRHHREDRVAAGDPERVRERDAEAVQNGGAVRVGDALGPAGGARRVAHGGGLALLELRPIRGLGSAEQLLVVGRPLGAAPECETTITCSNSRASRNDSSTGSRVSSTMITRSSAWLAM